MTTNRRPRKHTTRRRITPEAVAAFKTCLRFQDVYWNCLRGESCISPAPYRHTHCPECTEYLEASRTLTGELGLPPWAVSPADVEVDEPAPDYLANDPGLLRSGTWDEAVALRRELEKAAG